MANNYLLFSEALSLRSDEEKAWAQQLLSRMVDLAQGDFDCDADDDRPQPLPANQAEAYAYECFQGGWGWNLSYEVQKDRVWFYAEEGGDTELVGRFVMEFFRRWRPDGIFTLTWAETCSRPRLSEFGGGGMVVSAEELRRLDLHEWLRETIKDMQGDKR